MNLRKSRPNKHDHFLNRAKVVSERSTCLRRKVGAIIVSKDGVELSSGYSGAPRKMEHCIDIGVCLRTDMKIPAGQHYELCRSVHAEQNTIINAARIGVSIVGAEMYISSERNKDLYRNENEKDKIYAPCIICKKEIINVGLTEVHMREEGVGDRSYCIRKIKELLEQEEVERREDYLRERGELS